MNYKKESQFTNNASKRVFEEVYTNEDMPDNIQIGGNYRLNIPQMFANNPSQEKAISVRRVMCEPKPHFFTLRVRYTIDTEDVRTTKYRRYKFTSQNLMEEILNHIEINSQHVSEDDTETCSLHFDYDKLTGLLKISAVCNGDPIRFSFECKRYKDLLSFWSLLNQTGSPFGINPDNFTPDAMAPIEELTLTNVWNREPLYVHTTFSTSKRHYLCRTGDFWFKPSKYYYDNITQNTFELFFTTDGINRIIPYDGIKILELCFILRQFARL